MANRGEKWALAITTILILAVATSSAEAAAGASGRQLAAGVLVGDNRMQGTFERRYETSGDAAHEVPPEWQRDYKRWLKMQQKKKSGGR